MHLGHYQRYFVSKYMMGPNSIRLLDELLTRYPLQPNGRILDLGCGTGLTTLYTACEVPRSVIFAVDLWINAEDNLRRFQQWQIDDRTIPLHANALDLPFAPTYFDAVISVDAYHYFAANPVYFQEKLLPLVKPGGWILIAVPGLHHEFGECVPPYFTDWAGEETVMFHSCDWWRTTVGSSDQIAQAHFWEMDAHDAAWQDWFHSGHKYALQDQQHMQNGVWEHLTTVGMAIQRKA